LPKDNNNNLIWLLIAGILGLGSFALFGGNKQQTDSSNFTSQQQQQPNKKFGCGCNKGS
jgi:hypothetical protein